MDGYEATRPYPVYPELNSKLRGEFQTEATIRAGNQDGRHWLFIPWVRSSVHRRFWMLRTQTEAQCSHM